MPLYDRVCTAAMCYWSKTDCIEKYDARDLACPNCGFPTVREWTRPPAMIPDTFSTPLVDRVMDKTPQVFESRSAHRDAMRARGYVNRDEHVGLPGTDKSPHTTRWI
jgi:hypothetical protein